MLMTLGLGLSGSAALLDVAEGAAVVAVAVLPSRGELPTGALSVPSPGIVTGMNAHSRRQMVTYLNYITNFFCFIADSCCKKRTPYC